jgi:hypothetical protein
LLGQVARLSRDEVPHMRREFYLVLVVAALSVAGWFVLPVTDAAADADRAASAEGGAVTVYHTAGRAFARRTPTSSSYAARHAAGLDP